MHEPTTLLPPSPLRRSLLRRSVLLGSPLLGSLLLGSLLLGGLLLTLPACGRAPAPEPEGSETAAREVLGPSLRQALGGSGAGTFDVLVTFRGVPEPPPDVAGLYVRHDMGQGRLTRGEIERLAARDDVLAIELEPVDRPFEP